MAEYNDVIHTVEANQSLTGTGDGRSRLFPIKIGEQPIIPTVMTGLFVGDWQGSMSPMYPYPRTNYTTFGWDFTGTRWSPIYNAVATLETQEGSPDGLLGRVTSLQLDQCTGGPTNDRDGVFDTLGASLLLAERPYVFSVWLRADAPLVARLALDNASDTAGTPVNVGTSWQRVWVSATTRTGLVARGGAIILSQADNVGVAGDTKLYMVYAQTEDDFRNGFPSRWISTNGATREYTDYQLTDSNILTTDPLLNGSPLFWSGTGYWVEAVREFSFIPVDTLAGVTWRYDQSPRLLSLLQAKNDWYAANHTQFWRGWNMSIFDLTQANNFGVAVWAFILNVPLTALSLRDAYRYWAFGPTRDNFTDSNEPGEVNPTGGNFPPVSQSGAIATLKEKIQALRLKYYALTSDCSITSINKALADVFADEGLCYVEDHEDMTMTYVFTFPISADFRVSMLEYGLLPKPAGVQITITAP